MWAAWADSPSMHGAQQRSGRATCRRASRRATRCTGLPGRPYELAELSEWRRWGHGSMQSGNSGCLPINCPSCIAVGRQSCALPRFGSRSSPAHVGNRSPTQPRIIKRARLLRSSKLPARRVRLPVLGLPQSLKHPRRCQSPATSKRGSLPCAGRTTARASILRPRWTARYAGMRRAA